MPNYFATSAHDSLQRSLREFLEQCYCVEEIFINKDFRVVIWTSPTLLAISIHIIPTKFPDNMLLPTLFAKVTIAHIKIGAAFIDMSIRTMLSFRAFLSHEILTYLEIMAEIASLSIRTVALAFVFLASLYFAFIMGIGTAFPLPAFAMDKFLTDSVGSEFWGVIIGSGGRLYFDVVVDFCIDRMIGILRIIKIIIVVLRVMGEIVMGIWVLIGICHF